MAVRQFLPEGPHELWGAMGDSDFQLEGGGVEDWESVERVGDKELDAWGR